MSDTLITKSNFLLSASIGIGLTAAIGYYLHKKSKDLPPKNWELVGTLEEIIYFPIKSCSGIKLKTAQCNNLGIKDGKFKDRQFMVVDLNNKLVSARIYPKMLKIETSINNGNLFVNAPEMNEMKIDIDNFHTNQRPDIKANLWEKPVFVSECGPEYNKWFSQFLLGTDTGLKLVYYPFPIPTKEIVSKEFDNGIMKNEDTGTLQDVSSYMIINSDSVTELNTKLEEKITNRNFRGNFLIKTDKYEAFAEDNWNWIKIGDEAVFRKVSPCYRCIFTNINPKTAERSECFQPLKTLQSFRIFGAQKLAQMGIQCGIRTTGVVKLGDKIYVDV